MKEVVEVEDAAVAAALPPKAAATYKKLRAALQESERLNLYVKTATDQLALAVLAGASANMRFDELADCADKAHIGSRATVSRRKDLFIKLGLITETREKIGSKEHPRLGRPHLRLHIVASDVEKRYGVKP